MEHQCSTYNIRRPMNKHRSAQVSIEKYGRRSILDIYVSPPASGKMDDPRVKKLAEITPGSKCCESPLLSAFKVKSM